MSCHIRERSARRFALAPPPPPSRFSPPPFPRPHHPQRTSYPMIYQTSGCERASCCFPPTPALTSFSLYVRFLSLCVLFVFLLKSMKLLNNADILRILKFQAIYLKLLGLLAHLSSNNTHTLPHKEHLQMILCRFVHSFIRSNF